VQHHTCPLLTLSREKEHFVTASAVDPFGKILGIVTNVHYLDILKQKKQHVSHGNERGKQPGNGQSGMIP
jgi:hypothetical protein